MAKSKDRQAQEYAEKKIESEYGISREDFIEAGCRFGYGDVVQAHIDGYTACEQSIWRSVEEELPEDMINVLVHCSDSDPDISDCIAYLKNGIWCFMDEFYTGCNVSYWIPIPSLPDTNTENH